MHITTVTKLRRRDLKPVDKTPRTYDEKTFHLDDQLDLVITFGHHLCPCVDVSAFGDEEVEHHIISSTVQRHGGD